MLSPLPINNQCCLCQSRWPNQPTPSPSPINGQYCLCQSRWPNRSLPFPLPINGQCHVKAMAKLAIIISTASGWPRLSLSKQMAKPANAISVANWQNAISLSKQIAKPTNAISANTSQCCLCQSDGQTSHCHFHYQLIANAISVKVMAKLAKQQQV